MPNQRAVLAFPGRLPAVDEGTTVLARILVCWTLFDPTGEPLRCELCRTSRGLEIRCAKGNDGSAIREQPVASASEGLTVAALWKAAYVVAGCFLEAPVRAAKDSILPARVVRRTR